MDRSVIVTLLLAGCATTGDGTQSSKPFNHSNHGTFAPGMATEEAPADPVRIVDGGYGKENSKTSKPIVIPYGVNQSGTELVMVLLDQARQSRAAYVGDMELFATFKWGGANVECRSKVVYADDPILTKENAAPAPEPGKYGTNVEEFRPQLVSAEVSENDLECQEATEMVAAGAKTVSVGRMDTERRDALDRAVTDSRTEIQYRPVSVDRCQKKHVERHVQRYDYQLKLGFIPPDWQYISRRYADKPLAMTRPVCYAIAETKEPLYRMTAVTYHRGKVRTSETPTDLPSDEMLDTIDRENPLRPSICNTYGSPNIPACPNGRVGGDTPFDAKEGPAD